MYDKDNDLVCNESMLVNSMQVEWLTKSTSDSSDKCLSMACAHSH